ncbi:DUF934 domain-containing protein [Pseudohongiella acticola]|jgi:uncharacterized protein (DUF934 family)|uniref:DUF934 domain-containing protein n=1 Tax=Pseudohongiella acticola TaxID=1524254 RepID=UPI0030ED8E7D
MSQTLIKDGSISTDNWVLLAADTLGDTQADKLAQHDGDDIIVPLNCWLEIREQLLARPGKTGVWLQSNETPLALAEDLSCLPLIALNFPAFSDGRAYSSARELRQNMGYTGELRAIGDVLRDQLFYMARCGFNAFALRDDQNADAALGALTDFRDAYQASVDRPEPLFRRRA